MKKKLLCLLMALVMLLPLCLAACEGDTGNNGNEGENNNNNNGNTEQEDVFDDLTGFSSTDPKDWGQAKAHDPVVIESNGEFYTFSTDNSGTFGYQVRKSADLIHWEWVGNAIPNSGSESDPSGVYTAGTAELMEVYNLLKSNSRWANNYVLWAPDITEAADGGYWLYGCWTAAMYTGVSAIFLCYSKDIEGPYEYVDTLVYSPTNWANGDPNAIDPSIYYGADGKMYMAYGSFRGGIWVLELDPQTGLRKDGNNGVEIQGGSTLSQAERFGTKIMNTSDMEGPVISYHEDVAIYPTDLDSIKNYDASKLTAEDRYYMMGSANDLSKTYNMRSFYSTSPTSGFTSHVTEATAERNLGNRVSGSFSWRTTSRDGKIRYDFYAPGHNDMITTSDGKNLIVYHNRITFGSAEHYLFVSMYAFNSRGDLVINPNRYAGETLRKVEESEVSGKEFYYVIVDNNAYGSLSKQGYAEDGFVLNADNTVTLDGEAAGEWYLYGDNYVYMQLNDTVYYGVAFPAYIDRDDKQGISISLLSENGEDVLYMNIAS